MYLGLLSLDVGLNAKISGFVHCYLVNITVYICFPNSYNYTFEQ